VKRILVACLASYCALAVPAGAGDRCDLDGQPGGEVLVRYPLPDLEDPEIPQKHRQDHIVWKVTTALATQGALFGQDHPRVIGIGDFMPGPGCDMLWEEREPVAAPQNPEPVIRLLVTEALVTATSVMFWGGVERPPQPWQVAGTFDLTGDGLADVLWWNPETGAANLWVRSGSGWQEATVTGGLPPSDGPPLAEGFAVTAIARLQPEGGSPGVVWLSTANETMAKYHPATWNGESLRLQPPIPIPGLVGPQWSLAAVGDFDDDGDDDLMLRSLVDSKLRVCFMDGLTVHHCAWMMPRTFALPTYEHGWFVVGPR
jgi:hypothetical protein